MSIVIFPALPLDLLVSEPPRFLVLKLFTDPWEGGVTVTLSKTSHCPSEGGRFEGRLTGKMCM